METTNAVQGDGFAALALRSGDKLIEATVDDLGLAGLVDFRAQIDVSKESTFGFDCAKTERRWFTSREDAAMWLTSRVLAALSAHPSPRH